MKKIIAIGILGFVISAFNKPAALLADYREAYTGTYSCKFYNNHLSSESMHYVLDTGRINITVSKDAGDSVVQIHVGGRILKARLRNKVLHPYPQEGRYRGEFFGFDSINLGFAPTMASSIRYMGKKK